MLGSHASYARRYSVGRVHEGSYKAKVSNSHSLYPPYFSPNIPQLFIMAAPKSDDLPYPLKRNALASTRLVDL
jgi:hypothetical protein